MSSPPPPVPGPPAIAPRRRRWLLPTLLVLLIVSAAVGGYFAWFRTEPPKPEPDMEAVMSANLRGVGWMDRGRFSDAEDSFAEAVRLAPDWLPARINLGIAKMNHRGANRTESQHTQEAKVVFREVLRRDPDSKHAHYCLGILADYIGHRAEAHEHFSAVNKLDPNDAHTWLRLGANFPNEENEAARACFEQALKLDPYLNEARYRLAITYHETDRARCVALLDEVEALRKADRYTKSGIKYGEMGKYADVIGRDMTRADKPTVGPLPLFAPPGGKVLLAEGAKWATAADLSATQRERFGATIVLFDYNGDDKPDVFVASAVVEGGKVRDLLLRNDGGGNFEDVTKLAGLATPRPSLGAAAADYDNDGKPDLLITGAGEQHLFRNKDGTRFENVSAAVGLDKEKGVCLACGWIDLDQDGDLDLIVCKYANDATTAFDAAPGGGTLVFENVGVAPPKKANEPAPGLTTVFKPFDKLGAPAKSTVALVAADLDSDRDVDLLLLPDAADPVVIDDDRLLRFKTRPVTWAQAQGHKWNGGLVLDANHDERSDLFLIRADGAPIYLLSKGASDFAPGDTNSPALKQAVAADIDMDGWTDVVGLTTDGKAVLLHNQGDGKLALVKTAFGDATAHALAVADLDGDGNPDLLALTDAGLQLHRNTGNGNSAVLIDPCGKPESFLLTNCNGIGTWIIVQTGTHWTAAERTTVCAGLGQSLVPTALGIGKRDRPQLIRLRWPDGIIQAEFDIPTGVVHRLTQFNRRAGW